MQIPSVDCKIYNRTLMNQWGLFLFFVTDVKLLKCQDPLQTRELCQGKSPIIEKPLVETPGDKLIGSKLEM